MAQEPKAPAHERLTAYAAERRRRLGAPLMLPPQTRRILLDAVSRHFERSEPEVRPWRFGWIGGWMGWAWAGVALVAVSAGAIWMVRQQSPAPPVQVARNNDPIESIPAPAMVPAPPRAGVAHPQPAAPAPSAMPLAQRFDPPPTTTVQASAPRRAPAESHRGVAFEAGDPAGAAAAHDLPVLRRFRIEGDGQTIRIVDADGSIYEGTLLAAAKPMLEAVKTDAPSRQPRAAQDAAAPLGAQAGRHSLTVGRSRARETAVTGTAYSSPSPAPESFTFQAAGTNLSLNQSVRLVGQIVLTNRSAAGPTPVERRADGHAAPFQDFVQQSAVHGQAVLGDGRTLQVNATPKHP